MNETIEWALCKCGKERPVVGEEWERRLHKISLCRACDADFGQDHNLCPETVPIPGGVSACGLGWRHTGKCEPSIFKMEWHLDE